MRKDVKWLLIAIILAVLMLGYSIPVIQKRIISNGFDSFATHRPITTKNILGQTITLEGELTAVSAIIVPLNHTGETEDVITSILNENNETLFQGVIAKENIKDDTYASLPLPSPLGSRGERITILFSSKSDDPTVSALRFDPAQGTRLEAGVIKPGTYAIQVSEKASLWQAFIQTINNHPDRAGIIVGVFLICISISVLAYIGSLANMPAKKKIVIQAFSLSIIILIALSTRLYTLNQLGGVSGGDAYNYLTITKSIAHWENPFSSTKRLPGYPLLLIPTFLAPNGDPISTMRIIQILSALGVICMLPFLAKNIGLPWGAGFTASVLLIISKDFFLTSLRPEPYTLYACLLTGALLLFFNRTKSWQQYLFGVVLGYAAMTRQEGFLLAVVFGICEVIYLGYRAYKIKTFRIPWLPSVKSFAPAALIVSPFFIHNAVVYGNPFFTPYFEGERLQIVDSFGAFTDSLGATWGILGSLYKPIWDQLTRVSLLDPFFLSCCVFVLIIGLSHLFSHRLPKWVPLTTSLVSLIIPIIAATAFMTDNGLFSSLVTKFTAALVLISPVLFLIQTKWKGAALALVAVSQILIATWFHPFAKHYQQSIPLLLCMFLSWGTAFYLPFSNPNKKRAIFSLFPIACFLVPLFLSTALLWQSVRIIIDKENSNNALDSVVYRGIIAMRHSNKPFGFNQGFLQAYTFFSDEPAYFSDEDKPTETQEKEWLRNNNIQTLLTVNNNKVLQHLDSSWQQVASFKSEGDDERLFESFVYIKNP